MDPPGAAGPIEPGSTGVRIGCAGWSITTAQHSLFGQGTSLLSKYASRLRAVEINSSFYRPHRRNTYARWADSVPDDFRFAAKLPRVITHEQRLRGVGPQLDVFLAQAGGLGEKLHCLLVQLPPSLSYDARTASTFFKVLRRRWPGPVACEPRHASWFTAQVAAALQRHAVARVGADPAIVPTAALPGGDTMLYYWRWHGSPRAYFSAYGEEALQALALSLRSPRPGGYEAWVIFDNTAHGHAVPNALRLQQLVSAATQ